MDVEKEINLIKERNARVEADKAWETSLTRLVTIGLITYVTVLIFLIIIKVENPFLAALIPVIGFILSSQSIPVVKKWWVKNKK